jgi:hypothetical protein
MHWASFSLSCFVGGSTRIKLARFPRNEDLVVILMHHVSQHNLDADSVCGKL